MDTPFRTTPVTESKAVDYSKLKGAPAPLETDKSKPYVLSQCIEVIGIQFNVSVNDLKNASGHVFSVKDSVQKSLYKGLCLHTHVYTYTCIHTHTYLHMYTYTYTQTQTCIHVVAATGIVNKMDGFTLGNPALSPDRKHMIVGTDNVNALKGEHKLIMINLDRLSGNIRNDAVVAYWHLSEVCVLVMNQRTYSMCPIYVGLHRTTSFVQRVLGIF